MNKLVIGLDFGTNSCRSLIVDVTDGKEIASHVFAYPSGMDGVIIDESDPNLARQNPNDYLLGIEVTIKEAILKAADSGMDKVLKVTIYVTDMKLVSELNEVYPSYFSDPLPAREAVCVKELPLGASIEISVIAEDKNN